MKLSLTTADVLSDIEFELLQGLISKDDLGASIQAVKQYQSKLRRELFDSPTPITDAREMMSQQFQLNDMLITMLQEVAATTQGVQHVVNQLGNAPNKLKQISRVPQTSISDDLGDDHYDELPARSEADIQTMMKADVLSLKLDTQAASSMPLLGVLMQRLRVALHNLVLFYIQRLAKKQGAVNHTYGDWLLYLHALHRHQDETLEGLRQQIVVLQQQVAQSQKSSDDCDA